MSENELQDKYRVEYVGDVAILRMDNGENRFSSPTITAINKALDEIEKSDAKALITIGSGKFYSNGIDLKWLSQQTADEALKFALVPLVNRVLTFPMPTIAAINGHCYAGGAIFALAHDYRVMRTRQGWFCLPEIHLKLTFSSFKHVIKCKIPQGRVFTDMAVFGKRYTAEQVKATGVVDDITEMAGLMDLALHMAKQCLGKSGYDRETLKILKTDLYEDAVKETSVGNQQLLNIAKL